MPRIVRDFLTVEGLARQALRRGELIPGPMGGRWDISGPCENPVWVEYAGLGQVSDGGSINLRTHRNYVDMVVRCRECPNCLRWRAWQWTQRSMAEVRSSCRTWLVTLTLSPAEHFRMQCIAAARLPNFGQASASQQFGARHVACSVELTKWLKRVRKNSGAKLTYLLVAERHKSGLPHYHALIHEKTPDRPVTYRQICSAWTLGFTNAKLVDGTKPSHYVCKYLAKDASARVRASQSYGLQDLLDPRSGVPQHTPPTPPPQNSERFMETVDAQV